MLGVNELLLAFFIAGVFALVLGSSRLIFAVDELRWLGREYRNILEGEKNTGPEAESEGYIVREKFEENLVNFERGMRVAKAELIIGYFLLIMTLLLAVDTVAIDASVFVGVVIAMFAVLLLWDFVRIKSEELHKAIRESKVPID